MDYGAGFQIPADLDREMTRLRHRLLLTGAGALAACLVGAFFAPEQFFRSYLWVYVFYVGLTLGSMALLMLQYVTGGAWGLVIRRLCEAAARTLPLMALLFLPIVVGMPHLYEWSHADAVAADPILQHKRIYLNVPFFLVRAFLYFAGWILFSYLLNKWSAEEDRTTAPLAVNRKLQLLSGPGLLFYAASVTFMAVDWILSINPHWFSTIFALLVIAGQGLSALSLMIAVVVFLTHFRPFSEIITPRHLHDLGKLALALVMVWAYFSFSQFLIIWSGNLPHEIPFYVSRLHGGWQYVGVVLLLLHFALPFALLLSRDLKRNFRFLSRIAGLILVMRFVDLFWFVAPEFHKHNLAVSWMDLLLPIALGGIWLAFFIWQLQKRPLLPLRDPHLEEALAHGKE